MPLERASTAQCYILPAVRSQGRACGALPRRGGALRWGCPCRQRGGTLPSTWAEVLVLAASAHRALMGGRVVPCHAKVGP
eukprot:15463633-Alexandrium_andersonii.AAC.1